MAFGIGIAAWAKANPLPPPVSLPPHWLAPPIPRPEPAGFITGDWSVEYPEPQPVEPRDVFPRQAIREKGWMG